MIVYTTHRKINFKKSNINNVLQNLTPEISKLVSSDTDYVLVDGSLHNSQWTYDNPHGFHWLKIQGYSGNKLVPGLECVHVYMGFLRNYDSNIIVPYNIKGTDLPDVCPTFGDWVAVGITYTH